MAQADNVIPIRALPGNVTILPPPATRLTPGARLAIANTVRVFEDYAIGDLLTDAMLTEGVNRQLLDLELVNDPLDQVANVIADVRMGLRGLNRQRLVYDDMRDVLEEAALTLRSIIHWDFGSEFKVTL